MVDQSDWRVVVEFVEPGETPGDGDVQRAREFAKRLKSALITEPISRDNNLLFAYVSGDDEALELQLLAGTFLSAGSVSATVEVSRWDSGASAWLQHDGTPSAIRPRSPTVWDDAEPVVSDDEGLRRFFVGYRPKVVRVGLVITIPVAAIGVAWYVISPGVASFQLGGLLLTPAFLLCLVWLGARTPKRVQWFAAVSLAIAGVAGYLVTGGAQWWNWGQLAVAPVTLLIYTSAIRPSTSTKPERWYGGQMDGPWGPP